MNEHDQTAPPAKGRVSNKRAVCGPTRTQPGAYLRHVSPDRRALLVRMRRLDNWRNWFYLAGDWAVIAGASWLSIARGDAASYVLAVILVGSRQRGLMNLVHEASHRKLFRSRRLNDWAGRLLAGFPLLASLEAYVCSHCRHHGFLWDRERDPKTRRYLDLGLVQPPKRMISFVRAHVLRPLLLLHMPFNVWGSISWAGEPISERVARVTYLTVVGVVAIIAGWWPLVAKYWLVPYLTSFQVIRYFTEMAEHAGLDSRDPWTASRNWTASLPVRFIVGPHSDDLYHLVHHLFPRIPHYRLRAAHAVLMGVPEYAAGHHCDGFFFARRPEAPSVLQDIIERQESTNREPTIAPSAGLARDYAA
jgi:fatty acid desaturase